MGVEGAMADSFPTTPKTSTQPGLQTTQKEPATLQHDVPLPQDIEKSKLDWLLQINEQFFEAELKTVVSSFLLLQLSVLINLSTSPTVTTS